ncbi:MAG: carbohydrate porin [Phycisphaerae bacterium]
MGSVNGKSFLILGTATLALATVPHMRPAFANSAPAPAGNPAAVAPAADSAAAPPPVSPAPPEAPPTIDPYANDFLGSGFGLRPWLEGKGVTVTGSLVTDGSWNLSGGLSTRRSAWRSLLTVNVDLSTRKLFNLPGGTIAATYEGLWGQNGNTTQVGSLQGFDAIDAAPFSELYQLYYEQKFGRLLEFRIGRQDAGDLFGEPPDAQPFLNPSPTAFPTIIESAYYPESAPGLVAMLYPHSPLTFKFGAYYFDRFHPTALDQALNTLEPIDQPLGTFLISELDYSWQLEKTLPGIAAVGGTWRTGQLPTLNGSTQSSAGSWYAYIDQTLWADSSGRSIAGYEIIGGGDRRVANNAMDYASLGGLLFTGLVPTRPDDQIGLAYNWVHVSSEADLPKPYELGFETFYSFNFPRGISVQPDLQYFINTGGGTYPDALVATIRISLSF